ncbi:MAG: S23 ribosomal protein [Microgenomates group bacterium Gr01-1014_7]|nr:MAG: S23 ribosomal protein [Microgenomates group bacterium Gr01-1014_7]
MTKQNTQYNLEDRTLEFAKKVVDLIKELPRNIANLELSSQVIRSAGSIGANYREANDSLGKKDFVMRLKISRKESKETYYWLQLITHSNSFLKESIDPLLDECSQLIRIFSSIINKTS